MSGAFTKEESAETASEILLPERTISSHPNLVTEAGLQALKIERADARAWAERFSWRAASEQFASNLKPLDTLDARPRQATA